MLQCFNGSNKNQPHHLNIFFACLQNHINDVLNTVCSGLCVKENKHVLGTHPK
jgi:hypothetical protein